MYRWFFFFFFFQSTHSFPRSLSLCHSISVCASSFHSFVYTVRQCENELICFEYYGYYFVNVSLLHTLFAYAIDQATDKMKIYVNINHSQSGQFTRTRKDGAKQKMPKFERNPSDEMLISVYMPSHPHSFFFSFSSLPISFQFRDINDKFKGKFCFNFNQKYTTMTIS